MQTEPVLHPDLLPADFFRRLPPDSSPGAFFRGSAMQEGGAFYETPPPVSILGEGTSSGEIFLKMPETFSFTISSIACLIAKS